MIRKKNLDLDIFYVDLTLMEEHDVLNFANGSEQPDGQNVEKAIPNKVIADQPREEEIWVRDGNNENVNEFNLFSPNTNLSPDAIIEDPINVPTNPKN